MDVTPDDFAAILAARTPGTVEWEYGVSERTTWGLTAGDKYILRWPCSQDIDMCPDPEDDMAAIRAAVNLAPLLLDLWRADIEFETAPLASELRESAAGERYRALEALEAAT